MAPRTPKTGKNLGLDFFRTLEAWVPGLEDPQTCPGARSGHELEGDPAVATRSPPDAPKTGAARQETSILRREVRSAAAPRPLMRSIQARLVFSI